MIPKTFHQIWINRDSPDLPAEFAAYRDSWLRHHPSWAYRLWNLDNLDFDLLRPDLVGQCSSYAQLADLLRLEVLFHHGGVYVDTDFECFKPIDPLLEGLALCACGEKPGVISTGFIGAAPRSPLIEKLLRNLPTKIGLRPPNAETGPAFITQQWRDDAVATLPTAYLYPYAPSEARASAQTHPEAYAAHHWAHSWLDPKERTLWRRVRARLAPKLGLRLGRPVVG